MAALNGMHEADLVLLVNQTVLGLIIMRDDIRPDANPDSAALKAAGITPIMLIRNNRCMAEGRSLSLRAELCSAQTYYIF